MKKIYTIESDETGKETTLVDLTVAVQALYDLAVNSMDYGSVFWSYEDAAPVAALAELMGWEGAEGLRKYTDNELHKTESQAYWRDNGLRKSYEPWYNYEQVTESRGDGSVIIKWKQVSKPHEHAFSTVGRCMWYQCKETER